MKRLLLACAFLVGFAVQSEATTTYAGHGWYTAVTSDCGILRCLGSFGICATVYDNGAVDFNDQYGFGQGWLGTCAPISDPQTGEEGFDLSLTAVQDRESAN